MCQRRWAPCRWGGRALQSSSASVENAIEPPCISVVEERHGASVQGGLGPFENIERERTRAGSSLSGNCTQRWPLIACPQACMLCLHVGAGPYLLVFVCRGFSAEGGYVCRPEWERIRMA